MQLAHAVEVRYELVDDTVAVIAAAAAAVAGVVEVVTAVFVAEGNEGR
jgi:site-specific recombinase